MKAPGGTASTSNSWIWPAGVILLTLAVSGLIFKSYLIHPNQYMYAFGGDALAIYYDMVYHVCFDHGTTFQGMNYPYGEYIFLTDAQGAFSTFLQWIHHHLFPVGDYVPGIMHSLSIYLLPLCSVMMYYILDYFSVRKGLSLVFAVLITFLSPAMLRFGNHFGLAYPFLIPMSMLWILRKYHVGKPEIRDAIVLAILIFFSFNNPYTGFTSTGLLLCAGLILAFMSIKKRELLKTGIIVGGVGLLGLLIPFIVFQLNDPVQDRLAHQWGFFFYNATLEGLFYPPHSLLHGFLQLIHPSRGGMEYESFINIGIVATLLLLGILITAVLMRVRKTNWKDSGLFDPGMMILLGAAGMMFLYAANRAFFKFPQAWMENHLGPLLMFKASARIGWPLYFALTIWGVLFLNRMLKKIKSGILAFGIIFLLVTTWAIEIKTYVAVNYENTFHQNYFRTEAKSELIGLLKDHQIDISEYQAMLVIPKMMAWTDNFLSTIHWASQFYSQRISAATGLPIISAMLSRMSIGQTAEAIQMLSNPWIKRNLVEKLPNQKDILVLVGGDTPPLSVGEQYILDLSTPVYISKEFSLYRLKLDSLQNNTYIREARQLYDAHPPVSQDLLHLAYDDTTSPIHFYGQGARLVHDGETVILEESLPNSADTQYVFSAWTNFDHVQSGVGDWDISISDSAGQSLSTHHIETRRGYDIQDSWIRSEVVFKAPKGSKIKATLISHKDLYVDEVLLYPLNTENIIDLPGDKFFLLNGFKIEKGE